MRSSDGGKMKVKKSRGHCLHPPLQPGILPNQLRAMCCNMKAWRIMSIWDNVF